MNTFTIKDLEILSGIKAHTIRIWEQRYNFIKPKRTDTNIRYYSNDELKTILNISLLNKYGYKVSLIDKMSTFEIQNNILLLTNNEAQQEKIINDLINYMIELNVEAFENVLDKYIGIHKIDKTINTIIFSFLEKIGLLWQTNHINPGQEHLVTNIIRQKIIIGIEKTEVIQKLNKSALLFLPEGEHHEICLLYTHFLLKSKGFSVLYLGANVPLKDVVFVANIKKPLFIHSHLTATSSTFNIEKYLLLISNKLFDNKVILSGSMIQGYKKKIPCNVELKNTLNEVVSFINSQSN
jgi:DNA-binding transcriptional MerR regulator